MLISNWSIRGTELSGRARVIRQKIGRAAAPKSVRAHTMMSQDSRSELAAKLERNAEREWRRQMGG